MATLYISYNAFIIQYFLISGYKYFNLENTNINLKAAY